MERRQRSPRLLRPAQGGAASARSWSLIQRQTSSPSADVEEHRRTTRQDASDDRCERARAGVPMCNSRRDQRCRRRDHLAVRCARVDACRHGLGRARVADSTELRPVYDRANLVLAVREAAESFHELWQGRLGLAFNPLVPKEHWTRIKALYRRCAEAWDDEYDRLRPVAELRRELED
jgi:hypothetical protein